MTANPIELFIKWYRTAQESSLAKHRGAVCVSTVDEHGVPDARFVDLKEVSEAGFVFCTHLDSRKGRALTTNPHAALTFWWDHIERQVRVVGVAERIPDAQADHFFQQRSRDAQLTSWASDQSSSLDDPGAIEQRLLLVQTRFADGEIPRPSNWGGYRVRPTRIEFLTFRANRLHERSQYSREDGTWSQQWLQP